MAESEYFRKKHDFFEREYLEDWPKINESQYSAEEILSEEEVFFIRKWEQLIEQIRVPVNVEQYLREHNKKIEEIRSKRGMKS